MPDKRYPTLQQLAADRDWWLRDSGAHYRELAEWLREVARNCRLANPQRELLTLAKQTSAGPIIWNAAREAHPPNEDSAPPRRLGRHRLILESHNTSIRNTPGLSPGPLLRGRGMSNFAGDQRGCTR
jgi:hypothetical protein